MYLKLRLLCTVHPPPTHHPHIMMTTVNCVYPSQSSKLSRQTIPSSSVTIRATPHFHKPSSHSSPNRSSLSHRNYLRISWQTPKDYAGWTGAVVVVVGWSTKKLLMTTARMRRRMRWWVDGWTTATERTYRVADNVCYSNMCRGMEEWILVIYHLESLAVLFKLLKSISFEIFLFCSCWKS